MVHVYLFTADSPNSAETYLLSNNLPIHAPNYDCYSTTGLLTVTKTTPLYTVCVYKYYSNNLIGNKKARSIYIPKVEAIQNS